MPARVPRERPAWDERLTGWYEVASKEEQQRYHDRYRALFMAFYDPTDWDLGDEPIRWALAHAGYGSLAELTHASDADLMGIPSIGPTRLRRIRAIVQRRTWVPEWLREE